MAAPLPPSAADNAHLEGENVRKKWVNFALVETGGADEPMPNAKSAADGDSACTALVTEVYNQ